MAKGFRYTMEHIGDILVGKLVGSFSCLKSSTRGIVITYDLHELEKSKRNVQTLIGERVAQVKPAFAEAEIFEDEELLRLFARLAELDVRIDARRREREARLNPQAETAETASEAA